VWHTLQVEVHRLVWFVGILSFTVAIILFVIGLARKMSPLPAFVNGFILVVVANVPEVSARPDLSLTQQRAQHRSHQNLCVGCTIEAL
jgi:hypothetical protein